MKRLRQLDANDPEAVFAVVAKLNEVIAELTLVQNAILAANNSPDRNPDYPFQVTCKCKRKEKKNGNE